MISRFMKTMFQSLTIGLLFGVGESLFLAWRYGSLNSSKFFVVKVMVLYVAFTVFVGCLIYGIGALISFIQKRKVKDTDFGWVIFGSMLYTVVACFLIVDRDFFYFILTGKDWLILAALFPIFIGFAYLLRRLWVQFSKNLKAVLIMGYLSVALLGMFINRSTIEAFFESRNQETQPSVVAAENQPNILLIVVDALDIDHVSGMGYFRNTTPNIDKLLERGIVFSEYYTPTSTAPSVTSMFTGLKPETTKYNYVDDIISKDYFLLGELMKESGYSTAAFAWTYYIDSLFGFGQGIDFFKNVSRLDPAGYCFLKRGLWTIYKEYFPLRKYLEKLEFILEKIYDPKVDSQETLEETVEEQGGLEIKNLDIDEKLMTAFFDWTDNVAGKPFFAYLHLQGAHSPFVVPAHFKDRYVTDEELRKGNKEVSKLLLGREIEKQDLELMHALYDTRLRFSDEIVGQVIEGLKKRGAFQNTLIIIMGDHGSQIKREDRFEKENITTASVKWETFKPHAFLLFYYPMDFGGPRKESAHLLSVDILPTLADFLQYSLPGATDGKSFLNLLQD